MKGSQNTEFKQVWSDDHRKWAAAFASADAVALGGASVRTLRSIRPCSPTSAI